MSGQGSPHRSAAPSLSHAVTSYWRHLRTGSGRRYPVEAHTVAVGALRQLRCGARSGVVPKNSLRSLCSLRSNSFGKNEDEARCARRPLLCAPRRHRDRPHRVPPAAKQERRHSNGGAPTGPPQSRVRSGCGAPLKRRVAQGLRPRAQRASSTDSSRLFERRERSEQSEFRDGPHDRATQGSLRTAQTASVKRCGLSARGIAAQNTEHNQTGTAYLEASKNKLKDTTP